MKYTQGRYMEDGWKQVKTTDKENRAVMKFEVHKISRKVAIC